MGKLKYRSLDEGYVFISDRGLEYDLLEGIAYRGEATSDIIFVMLSFFNNDNSIDTTEIKDALAGYFYGAGNAITDADNTVAILDDITRKFEDKLGVK